MPTGTALRVGAAPRADPNCCNRNGAAAFVLAKNGVVDHPFFEMNGGRTLFRWSFWPPLRPFYRSGWQSGRCRPRLTVAASRAHVSVDLDDKGRCCLMLSATWGWCELGRLHGFATAPRYS